MGIVFWIIDLVISITMWCVNLVISLFSFIFKKNAEEKAINKALQPVLINNINSNVAKNRGKLERDTMVSDKNEYASALSVDVDQASAGEATSISTLSLREQVQLMKSVENIVEPINSLEISVRVMSEEVVNITMKKKIPVTRWLKCLFISGVIAIGVKILGTIFCVVAGWFRYYGIDEYDVLGIMIFSVLVALLILWLREIKKYSNEKMNALVVELGERQSQALELMKKASEECKVLHTVYCHPNPLRFIISSLETGRADTIKDAINLYENEIKSWTDDEKSRLLLLFGIREAQNI